MSTPLAAAALALVPVELLGPSTILRSLIVFNALFALQTVLDLTYLWGGARCPTA